MVDPTTAVDAPTETSDVVKVLALEAPESPSKRRPSFSMFAKGSKSTSHIDTKKRKSIKKRFGGLVQRMSSARRVNKANKEDKETATVDPAVNASFDTAEDSTGVPSSTENDKISQDGGDDKVIVEEEPKVEEMNAPEEEETPQEAVDIKDEVEEKSTIVAIEDEKDTKPVVTEASPSKIPTIVASVYLVVVVPALFIAFHQAFADVEV